MSVKIDDIKSLMYEIEELDRDIYRAKRSYTEWEAALKDENLSLYEVDFMYNKKRYDISIRGGNSSHDIALKIMQYLVDDTSSQIDICAKKLNEKLEKLTEYKKLFPDLDLSWKTEEEKEKEREAKRQEKRSLAELMKSRNHFEEEICEDDPCDYEKEDSCFSESRW